VRIRGLALVVAGLLAAGARAERPLGIDISFWQGTITPAQWSQVYASGKSFAFIKASQGTTIADSKFYANIVNAPAAGLLAGPYHFADPAAAPTHTAVDEANYFVAVAGSYMVSGYIRPVLDIERTGGMDKTALSKWVNDFCNRVAVLRNTAPIVYTNTNYATNYLDSSVKVWTLWIAAWGGNPQTGSPGTGVWPAWAFWQYSNAGAVPGISGDVDLDVFNGTQAELLNFLVQGTTLPQIALAPASLAPAVRAGRPLPAGSFTVRNSGGGTLYYSITSDQGWLSVSPGDGTSDGETDTITVTYLAGALPIGTHPATITVKAPASPNSPRTLPVTLTIEAVPGDLDADGDIDAFDIQRFMGCMTAPGEPPADPACAASDFDHDADVDQSDYGTIQKCLSGSTVPADPECPDSP
jgi:GH25 family lysozyme M1 (1,4-beta-N-acetylmuramidase)